MVTLTILAFGFLTAPPNAPVPSITPDNWQAIRTAVHDQAIECEILDRREDRFSHYDQFAADLTAMRYRYRSLRNAPPLRDAQRFPNRHQVADMLQFNRAYRRHLDARQVIDRDRASLFKDAIRETDELYQIWDLVREAGCEIYYVPVRRKALKDLRDQLGPAAYYAGVLPPHVPLWRFVDSR